MKLYNKPRSNQTKEIQFQQYLTKNLPSLLHVNETYKLSGDEFDDRFLDIRSIEKLLNDEVGLSSEKIRCCLGYLNGLPNKIKVAKNCNLVSVDFVIIDLNGAKTYVEFHESQHRNLSVSRMTPVFDEFDNRFDIPRFVQRLLKDIWRFENLPNYKIVWYDWFEANRQFDVHELLFSGRSEFEMEGRFSFSRFCSLRKNLSD